MAACTRRAPELVAEQPSAPRALTEIRLLDGPNLYFPKPAAKVTVDIGPLMSVSLDAARAVGVQVGLAGARPGPPGSVFRQRSAIRLVTRLVRRLAAAGGVNRLAVRCRPGAALTELIVAYPWRNSRRAEGLAYGLGRVLDGVEEAPDAV